MTTISNGESGLSVRNKLNEVINKIEGVTSIGNNIDVTGTITSDGLTAATTSAVTVNLSRDGTDGDAVQIFNGPVGTTKALGLGVDGTNGTINSQFGGVKIQPAGTTYAFFATGGDISFYEDTGTTPKFFWDASAESLGIGTSSPTSQLSVLKNQSADTAIEVSNLGAAGANTTASFILSEVAGTPRGWFRRYRDGTARVDVGYAGDVTFSSNIDTTPVERMRIDSSGNLLVGTTSSLAKLVLDNAANTVQTLIVSKDSGGTGAHTHIEFQNTNGAVGSIVTSGSATDYNTSSTSGLTGVDANTVAFRTNSTEAMRIDSSGNVGIGTSNPQTRLHITELEAVAILRLQRSGATNAADAELGQIEFYNSDGTSDGPNVTAKIVGSTFSAEGAGGNLRFFTHDGTEGGEGSDPVERLRVDGSGRVGIGTSSPSLPLHIEADQNHIRLEDSTAGAYSEINMGDSGLSVSVDPTNVNASTFFRVQTDGTERMRIDSSGNVGIGTSSPAGILDIFGGDVVLQQAIDLKWMNTARDTTYGAIEGLAAGTLFKFGGTERMRIDSSGNVGIGTSSPQANIHAVSASDKTTIAGFSGLSASVRVGSNTDGGSIEGVDPTLGVSYKRLTIGGSDLRFNTNGTSEAMRIDSSGNVGIGTSSPASLLHLNTPGASATSNGLRVGQQGWTVQYGYLELDTASTKFKLGTSSTSFPLVFETNSTEAVRIDTSGNVLIGGTTAGTASAGNLVLVNGTAPTGNVTDGITLYAEDVSASSELKVRDEAGNVTTLSPHNFDLIPEGPSEDMAWSYYSERDGKRINVDMLKAIRLLEQITGEKLVHMA